MTSMLMPLNLPDDAAADAKRRGIRPLRVAELFGPVIQGEGPIAGRPTCFVRFGGCDYRCAWCDSLHAVLPQYRETWRPMPPGHLLASLLAKMPHGGLITLSGGNPAIQPPESMYRLLTLGRARGFRFACETQGSHFPDWFRWLAYLIVSPKPPSAGEPQSEADRLLLAGKIEALAREAPVTVAVKVPVFDTADLDWAGRLFASLPWRSPYYLSVGNPTPQAETTDALKLHLLSRYRRLSEEVLKRGWTDVVVLPQLHVLMYGNEKGR